MKIRKSDNGYLWYVKDDDDKIVRVEWSEEACVYFLMGQD